MKNKKITKKWFSKTVDRVFKSKHKMLLAEEYHLEIYKCDHCNKVEVELTK